MSNYERHFEQANKRIQFVLDHPGLSPWLKEAVSSALERDPVEVLNDLEIINVTLKYRCELLLGHHREALSMIHDDRAFTRALSPPEPRQS
jgi:hypothetical protein